MTFLRTVSHHLKEDTITQDLDILALPSRPGRRPAASFSGRFPLAQPKYHNYKYD